MNIQLLMNGDIEMSLSRAKRHHLRKCWTPDELMQRRTEELFVFNYLKPLGYKQILPEECGALTDAVLITDGKTVWGDMSYQVQSFLEELVKGNKVIWKRG